VGPPNSPRSAFSLGRPIGTPRTWQFADQSSICQVIASWLEVLNATIDDAIPFRPQASRHTRASTVHLHASTSSTANRGRLIARLSPRAGNGYQGCVIRPIRGLRYDDRGWRRGAATESPPDERGGVGVFVVGPVAL